MAVIIMQSIISQLKNNYPNFTFSKAHHFSWDPTKNIIFFNEEDKDCSILILHELAHAILKHNEYHRDIELISMECKAWDKSKIIAKEYGIKIDENVIQSALDTYRDWMHQRSLCPSCGATGLQSDIHTYKCLACKNSWQVNEARQCALRRYNNKKERA